MSGGYLSGGYLSGGICPRIQYGLFSTTNTFNTSHCLVDFTINLLVVQNFTTAMKKLFLPKIMKNES